MSQMNQIIVEGNFLHFTSPKGAVPMGFVLENINRHQTVEVGVIIESKTMSDAVISRLKRGVGVRVVGRLGTLPRGRKMHIFCEHIETKPTEVQKYGY